MTALRALLVCCSAVLVVLLVVPLGALMGGGASGLARVLVDREVLGAIALTVLLASGATLLAVAGGTPLAWWLARKPMRGGALIDVVLELPLVVPHPVLGMALLLVVAPGSGIGRAVAAVGLPIVGHPLGILCAMLIVSAPLYILGAREAIAAVDGRLEGVARTLGDTPWRAAQRVTVPLARAGLVHAATTMWARAVSEFGAIVLVAYHPRVASVLAYDRFTTYGLRAALPVAALLLVVSALFLLLLRAARQRAARP